MTNDPSKSKPQEDPAVNLIRSKISALYGDKPLTDEKPKVQEEPKQPLSKHQKYMLELNNSGKPLETIQTEWHEYYSKLPDKEKHEVWQEFYSKNNQATNSKSPTTQSDTKQKVTDKPSKPIAENVKIGSMNSTAKPANRRLSKRQKAKLSAQAHFKSLLFGLSMGSAVVIILLFGFFNERFVAPFITPSKTVSSMPIIVDPNSTTAGPEPLIVIPKINVEVPVVYDVPTIQEKDIQKGLEDGVVHYATTPSPGEKGNIVVVGHSSNNILNSGKYKFAFVLLNKLEVGDTFSMTKDSKRYTYKIYEKKIVSPTDISVLGGNDKASTVTLITCDPPGTSINRLIVVGEQISPDPIANVASTAKPEASNQPAIIPGNAQSLWSRLTSWMSL